MLSDAMVGPILPAEDMARAKAFYTGKLGLSVLLESAEGTAFGAGNGTMIFVYPYGKTKAEHTVAGFNVTDAEATVKELRAAGVVFEDYDLPGLKTVDGIVTLPSGKGAWFKDSEGNILSVIQMS